MDEDLDKKIESDLSTCRLCEKIKVRRYVGKYPNGRDKKYVDEKGQQWCGRKCPDCQADRARNNMRRIRKNGKPESNT
jgi:hypothetical protein